MAKLYHKLQPYQAVLLCKLCGGDMEPLDMVNATSFLDRITSTAPTYPHKCTDCGNVTMESRIYPAVIFYAESQAGNSRVRRPSV